MLIFFIYYVMKKYLKTFLTVIWILCSVYPVFAQEHNGHYPLTKAQKGVRISTDVLVVAMPVAALTGVLIEKDWEGLRQGVCSAITELGTTLILKYAIKEERPDHSNFHSFPSGHTANAFATATFLQRRYGWKFGVPAYILSGYVGWGRVYGKKHHWWDVLAGAAIGAGASLIYTRPYAKKHELVLSPGMTPYGFNLAASFTF